MRRLGRFMTAFAVGGGIAFGLMLVTVKLMSIRPGMPSAFNPVQVIFILFYATVIGIAFGLYAALRKRSPH